MDTFPQENPVANRKSKLKRELVWASALFALMFLTVLGLGSTILIKDLSNKEVFKLLHGYSKELEGSLATLPTTETLKGYQQEKVISTRLNEFITDKKIFDSYELYDEKGHLVAQEDRLKAGGLVYGANPTGPQPGQQQIETGSRIPISVKVPISPGKLGTAILSVSEDVLARQATQFRNEMMVKVLELLGIILLMVGCAYLYVLRVLRISRRIEAEALDQQRLSYLGLLSSGMAHEIKNPLNSIQMNLQMLEEEVSSGSSPAEVAAWITPIQKEIRRLERLVNDFLLFARPLKPERAPVDVPALLESISQLVAEEARQLGAELQVDVAPGLTSLPTDEGLLRTALLNLVLNAIQAQGGPGRIALKASGDEGRVVIEVCDEGPGVPEDKREQIFQIFFTTKAGGTGLGLPIARRIAEVLGGTLALVGGDGRGACFRMSLPAEEA